MSVRRAGGGGAGTVAVSTRDIAGGGVGAIGCATCGAVGTGSRTASRGRIGFSRGGTGAGGGERNAISVRPRFSSAGERPVDETEVIETSAVKKSAIVAAPDAASSVHGSEPRRGSKARLSRLAVRMPYGGRGIRTPESLPTSVFKFADTICAPFPPGSAPPSERYPATDPFARVSTPLRALAFPSGHRLARYTPSTDVVRRRGCVPGSEPHRQDGVHEVDAGRRLPLKCCCSI